MPRKPYVLHRSLLLAYRSKITYFLTHFLEQLCLDPSAVLDLLNEAEILSEDRLLEQLASALFHYKDKLLPFRNHSYGELLHAKATQ